MKILFNQFFDEVSSTYTYLLGDLQQHRAVLIDPVRDNVSSYISVLNKQKISLSGVLETHIHADHISGASMLRDMTGAQIMISVHAGASCADVQLQGDEILFFGDESITVIATPGHTQSCLSFMWRDLLFTGDALLIGTCGRTDFQGGDAGALYDSITKKIWSLPGKTLIYPAHDYQNNYVSTVAQERESNMRFSGKSRDEFIASMAALNLPMPRLIHQAVPANLQCGCEAVE